MSIKKLLGAFAVVLAVTVGATGCGSRPGTAAPAASTDAAGSLVGISMPTQTSERWIADGKNVSESLAKLGYKTDLQYANDDIPTQVSQIENMLTKGAKALIIAAIDGTTLTDVLAKAEEQNVKVIAYDRLINGSPNVDYYATFDNYKVGVQQATSLLTGLGLVDADGKKVDGKGPFNVELFAGSPDDNNANFFWNGAMDTLKPYLDDGTLKVPSGQTKFEQAAILRWQPATAQKRMEDILTGRVRFGHEARRRAVALRRPVHRHHLGTDQHRRLLQGQPYRSSPARTPRRARSSRSSPASSTPRSSRTPASSANRP